MQKVTCPKVDKRLVRHTGKPQAAPFSSLGSRKMRSRSTTVAHVSPHLTTQVAFELAKRSLVGGNSIAALSKGSTLAWYGFLGVCLASVGAWVVYLTGFLYRKLEPAPPKRVEKWLHDVDVTDSRFLTTPRVTKAADFAARAHAGQSRLTGHPYVTHVIETAAVVEGILRNSSWSFTLGERAEMAVVTALLHDVLDDTAVTEEQLEAKFGAEITDMVKKVSRLSSLNQLLRRKRRHKLEAASQDAASLAREVKEEQGSLQNMLVLMSDEPLVIVVKLADRLHNMRTAYALAPNKRQAVATETMEVWCSLAERLGMFAVKSELEDLCFAILQPEIYRQLHADRNKLWQRNIVSPAVVEEADRVLAQMQAHQGNVRGPETATTAQASTSYETDVREERKGSSRVLKRVQRFIPEAERRGLSTHSHTAHGILGEVAQGTRDMLVRGEAAVAQQQQKLHRQFLARRQQEQPHRHWKKHPSTATSSHRKVEFRHLTEEQRRMQDLLLTVLRFDDTTYSLGRDPDGEFETDLAGLQDCADRLIYEINVESVATGLQVYVAGRLKSLYSVWKKMQRKQASLSEIYDARALRIVVDDQYGQNTQAAIEACYRLLGTVQRLWRKVSSEDDDDYIANPKPSGYQSLHTAVIGPGGAPLEVQIRTSSMHEVAEYGRAAHWTYKENTPPLPGPSEPGTLHRGQPVMRAQGGNLNLGVVLEWDSETRRCLVAIKVNSRPLPGAPISRSVINALVREVEDNGWCRPGDGNFSYYLEMFAFYKDRKFHNTDVYNARRGATLTPLMIEEETKEDEGKKVRPEVQLVKGHDPMREAQRKMDDKIRVLREVLEWGKDMKASMDAQDAESEQLQEKAAPASAHSWKPRATEAEKSIIVLVFPEGDFQVVPQGTTAADIIHQREIPSEAKGVEGPEKVVNVNNLLVPEDTLLKKGDFVIRSRQLQDI